MFGKGDEEVQIADEKNGEKRNVMMAREDVGSFEGCNRLVQLQLVLAKDASVSFYHSLFLGVDKVNSICELKPYSFDGVPQPLLLTR